MTVKELKATNRSFWETLQYVGFVSENIPAVIKTRLDGGKASMQNGDAPPFTGQAVLSVTMGGLRNKEISSEVKDIFKKELFPILAEVEDFTGFDENNSGRITLHFNEGLLTTFK